MQAGRHIYAVLWTALFAVVAVLAVWKLESHRVGVNVSSVATPGGPATVYTAQDTQAPGPLVLVAHGFAGSTQMMQTISLDLARAGFTVAAFDFAGHGRSVELLSPDIGNIAGTTRQLVDQAETVLRAVREQTGTTGPVGLVGHSMATDIIIRLARRVPDAAGIVAVSMYSEAVSPTFPERLLMISGAWEARLREAALNNMSMVAPDASEGETRGTDGVLRRAVAVPGTEHVAVLFSTVTLRETRNWLGAALSHEPRGRVVHTGLWVLVLLVSLVAALRGVSRGLGHTAQEPDPPGTVRYLLILLSGAVAGTVAGFLTDGSLLGMAGFGGLFAFMAVWGLVTLALLYRSGMRMTAPPVPGLLLLLVWGLAVFAPAMDRYAASFVPAGPRVVLMALLMPAAVAFMLADRILHAGAAPWQRMVGRIMPVAALALLMIAGGGGIALLFTVLPVLVLFFIVYGTMGTWISRRSGPEAAGVALGACLAWAIAASTPLFAG